MQSKTIKSTQACANHKQILLGAIHRTTDENLTQLIFFFLIGKNLTQLC